MSILGREDGAEAEVDLAMEDGGWVGGGGCGPTSSFLTSTGGPVGVMERLLPPPPDDTPMGGLTSMIFLSSILMDLGSAMG